MLTRDLITLAATQQQLFAWFQCALEERGVILSTFVSCMSYLENEHCQRSARHRGWLLLLWIFCEGNCMDQHFVDHWLDCSCTLYHFHHGMQSISREEFQSVFAGCLRRTHIIAQRFYLRIIDVAFRDAETRVRNNHSVTSSIPLPPIQYKVQHTNPSVLAATRKPCPVPATFILCTQDFGY